MPTNGLTGYTSKLPLPVKQLVLNYLQIRDPLYAMCPIEVTHQPAWSTLRSIRIVNLENMMLHIPPPPNKEGRDMR